MAMVYGIIQRSQGTIDVASEVGKGTRFTFRLPLGTAAETEFELPGSTKPTSILHILAVDDDPEAQRTLARLLRAMGHSIDLATDGHQALEKFRVEKYDLVVTDRAMPDMNGDQLAGAIKALVPEQLVIMLTGFGEIMKSWRHRGQTPNLYYYRDKDKKEIDFLFVQDGTLFPVEVKLGATANRDWARGFSVLGKLEMPVGPGGVVCLCREWLPLGEKITAIPAGLI